MMDEMTRTGSQEKEGEEEEKKKRGFASDIGITTV